VKLQLDAYSAGEIDAVYLAYTRFINTMKQEPVVEQLLPLDPSRLQETSREYSWDYLYEPDAQACSTSCCCATSRRWSTRR
jgi:F-type H+-transporting ATPase subunit gamma